MENPTCVPPVPMDLISLRKSIKMWHDKGYINDDLNREHNELLDAFRAEDVSTCDECRQLRVIMAKNGKSVHHDQAQATMASSKYSKAYKDMKKHLREANDNHNVFRSPLPWPHKHYEWDNTNKRYAVDPRQHPAEAPLTQQERELVDRLASQRVDGVHVHAVGKGAKTIVQGKKTTLAKDRLQQCDKSITKNMYAIARDINKAGSWIVIYITNVIFSKNDRTKVQKVKYREMQHSNPGTRDKPKYHFRWAKWGVPGKSRTKVPEIINMWAKKFADRAPEAGFTQDYLVDAKQHINPERVAWAESLITWVPAKDMSKILNTDNTLKDKAIKDVVKVLERREDDNIAMHALPSEELGEDEYEEDDDATPTVPLVPPRSKSNRKRKHVGYVELSGSEDENEQNEEEYQPDDDE